jgi:hypothetical protein
VIWSQKISCWNKQTNLGLKLLTMEAAACTISASTHTFSRGSTEHLR